MRGPLLLVSRPDGLKRGDSERHRRTLENLSLVFLSGTGPTDHPAGRMGSDAGNPHLAAGVPCSEGIRKLRAGQEPGRMGWVKDPQSSFLRRHYPDQVQRMFRSEDRTLSRKLSTPAPRRSLARQVPAVGALQTSAVVFGMRLSGKPSFARPKGKNETRIRPSRSGHG